MLSGGALLAKNNPYTSYAGSVYAIYPFLPDFDVIGGVSGFANNNSQTGIAVDLQLGLNVPLRSNIFVNLGLGGSYLDYSQRIYAYGFSYGLSYNINQRVSLGVYDFMRFKPGRGILNQQVMLGLTIKLGNIDNSLVDSGSNSDFNNNGFLAYKKTQRQRDDKIKALKIEVCKELSCDNQKNIIKTSNVFLLKKNRVKISSLLNNSNTRLLLDSDLSNNLKEYFVNRVGIESSKIDVI